MRPFRERKPIGPMRTIDALICPRWLIRMEPRVEVEEGLALAIDGGRILAVLPVGEAEERFAPAARHDRPEHVLLPGLVNAHTHAAMTLFRGLADDLPLERWLHERIWPAESRWVGPELVADGTRLAAAEMLAGGTTCFADMYYYPEIVGEVAVETGIRTVLGMIALETPTAWAANADEYLRKGLEVHDRFRSEALVTAAFAPHAPYTVGDATLAHIRRLADELDVPVHMHVHETAAEVAEAVARTGRRPLARLDTLGLVNPSLMAVHATQLEAAEIELLATAGASVVHCPRSNLKLASGLCPVAKLRHAGVNVALGTDGAASNNRLDLFQEMRSAALLAKAVARDAAAMPAHAALHAATLGGATALGLEKRIGSIVPGKAADLAAVAFDDIELQPVYDVVSHLVYASGREHVTDVWVGGERVLQDGKLTRLELSDLQGRALLWQTKILN